LAFVHSGEAFSVTGLMRANGPGVFQLGVARCTSWLPALGRQPGKMLQAQQVARIGDRFVGTSGADSGAWR
jgi:hypothetical protein